MFKANKKDTRTTSMTSFYCFYCRTWTCFAHCSGFSNVIFEQVRSSHQQCCMEKGVLNNFPKFTGKYLCQSLLFNKVAGLHWTLLDDCFLQVNTRCEISWKFLKSFWSLHKKWSSLLRISLVTFLMFLGKSSHSQMFFKIGVLKISQYSQKSTCVGVLNKVAGLQACSFIKKRLQHKCFFVNIAKIFKSTFFIEHLRWLLLFILAGNGFRE